ncbi:unnamed protein product [Coffea canephora]|uniref:Uncharacterized protein n=1 Tax=Coffea canephora TaxID=49390 RepID=A0A068U070_COFCA|nr:unnamed protein product [Coffea canephora]
MNNSKVHSQRTVPFSWENKPGVSKDSKNGLRHHRTSGDQGDFPIAKLPPPPCRPEKSRASFHSDLQIPPPPCPNFQHPLRSSSRRISFKKNDDPFLLAYKECTKSTSKNHKGLSGVINRIDVGLGLKKNLSVFSCKHSGNNVIDDSVVRISQLPVSNPRESLEE